MRRLAFLILDLVSLTASWFGSPNPEGADPSADSGWEIDPNG